MTVELGYDYEKTTALMQNFSQKIVDDLKAWTLTLDPKKCVPKNLTYKQLVLFYNACDGDVEQSKICIEKYYLYKKNAPEIFDDRDFTRDDIKEAIDNM